jgi:TolB-like protein
MEFRIGVNLGDVIEEEERIYGDGVNVAARVEGLADAGGICISGTAFDQVRTKLSVGYEYLGEQTVKNIPEPVRVYRVLMEPELAGKVIGEKRVGLRQWQWLAVVVAAFVGAAVVVVWDFYLRKPTPTEEVASEERMVFPLPDKPAIAVLPFINMSEDPKQEYFSDGITEDLITDLSSISGLFVIARNSTFAYKGKRVKIRQVAEELGVRYILEGSVRRADNRVRINAQLIDATTGHHLWAKRYDATMVDVFDLQDKITQKIVAALAVKLTSGEQEQVVLKHTDNVAAYDAFLQGREHYVRRTPDNFAEAIRYFERAIELDQNYGRAYAALALTHWESQHNFWSESLGVSWNEARMRAEIYLQKAMNNPTALAHQVASKIHVDQLEHEEAIAKAQRAITLDPNDGNSYLAMAYALIHAGRPKEALDFVQKAMRLDPHYPAYHLFVLGLAHFNMEQFNEAAISFERALKRNPKNYVPLIHLAATYAHLGREQEAAAVIEKLSKVLPIFSVDIISWRISIYKDPVDLDRLLDGLRKAGLPESHHDVLRKLEKK